MAGSMSAAQAQLRNDASPAVSISMH